MARARMSYDTKTNEKIAAAFLEVLSQKPLAGMSVAEVARAANISRSTFYAHYNNLSEVFDELVASLAKESASIERALFGPRKGCLDSEAACRKPTFCGNLRSDSRFALLAKEPRFLTTFLGIAGSEQAEHNNLIRCLMEKGLDSQQAYAVYFFQMSGCFAASILMGLDDAQWEHAREGIDRFIRSGMTLGQR